MKIREAIGKVSGFRFMMERLHLSSSLGRHYLYETNWKMDQDELEAELDRVEKVYRLLVLKSDEDFFGRWERKLNQVRDIRGTVARLGQQRVLDDVGLFELKHFALLATDLRDMLEGRSFFHVADLNPVVNLLDPEHLRIPQFYIYNAYSKELAEIRRRKKERIMEERYEEAQALFSREVELEDEIRAQLSRKLGEYVAVLQLALEQVAQSDILIAKAREAVEMGLVRAVFSSDARKGIRLRGMFHPQLKETLQQSGKSFQAVDVDLYEGTTLITGANMTGKTVLLKSVALAQHLFQFGFFVPAREAELPLVEDVQISIGDEQDELSGLSSFTAEMTRLNAMTHQVKDGKKILVLLDEVARTTNPIEGRAIVNGVTEYFTDKSVMAMVTTHYGGIRAKCRKLRVKGFVENKVEGALTMENMNEYIDYSLVEDYEEEVPQEALKIARMLGMECEILDRAEEFLKE